MAYKTSLNYSPNFSNKKRKKNQIKFIIFHYTETKTLAKAVPQAPAPTTSTSGFDLSSIMESLPHSPVSKGNPSCSHAKIPPLITCAFSKPRTLSFLAESALELPDWQQTNTNASLYFSNLPFI